MIAESGCGPVFGLVGDANLYLVDSHVREYGGAYHSAASEAGAVLMALGHAAISGRVGLASVTHGPAVTNTVTALAEGVRSFTPLVLMCGDTAAHDRGNLQDIPQREVILASGAGFEQMRSAATAVEDFARALRRAWEERRPIAFNIPTDLQKQEVEYRPRHWQFPPPRQAVVPAEAEVEAAVGILATARRPIVLAGRGAIDPAARAALLRLAARLDAPVMTTLKARELFRGEGADLGIFGTLSTPAGVEAIMASDCVIAFGAGLNAYTTAHGAYVAGRRVVQVSREAGDLGRGHLPDAGVTGDAVPTVEAILHWLDEAEIAPSGFLAELQAAEPPAEPPRRMPAPAPGRVDYIEALAALDAILPRDRVLVTDAGRFVIQAFRRLTVQEPRLFLQSVAFGSIGLGLPCAIGAGVAEPGRPVVLVIGDGGFMLGGLQEFHSAVRNRTDLIVLLCNDGSYGAEHVQLREKQMDPGAGAVRLARLRAGGAGAGRGGRHGRLDGRHGGGRGGAGRPPEAAADRPAARPRQRAALLRDADAVDLHPRGRGVPAFGARLAAGQRAPRPGALRGPAAARLRAGLAGGAEPGRLGGDRLAGGLWRPRPAARAHHPVV